MTRNHRSRSGRIRRTCCVLAVFLAAQGLFTAQASAESYEYNSAGRLTRLTYDDGSSIGYSYDKLGNLVLRDSSADNRANRPPNAFDLVYPANGQTRVPTSFSFIWKEATDPDGDLVTYQVTHCQDAALSGCSPQPVASNAGHLRNDAAKVPQTRRAGTLMYGLSFLGLLGFGALFVRRSNDALAGVTVRIQWLLTALSVLLFTGVMACGGGDNNVDTDPPTPGAGERGLAVADLEPGTTYYWKVVASDGKGGTTESATWSFTTR